MSFIMVQGNKFLPSTLKNKKKKMNEIKSFTFQL